MVLLINLFVFFRKQSTGAVDTFDEDEDEDDDDDYEPVVPVKKPQAPAKKPANPGRKDIEVFDFNDED